MFIQNVDLFIKYINEFNSIMKNVYNSKDKFDNIWYYKCGKAFMYEENQFPSYVESYMSYDSIPKMKSGKLAKKAIEIQTFLKEIEELSFKIISKELYEFFKGKKDIISIEIKDKDYIEFKKNNGLSIKFEYGTPPKEYEFDENKLLRTIKCEEKIVMDILDKGNDPFQLIWNFNDITEDTVNIEDNIDEQLGHVRIKLNKKFIPYLCKKKKKEDYIYNSLSLECYETHLEGIYDLAFISDYDILQVNSVIRFLDI